MPVPDRHHRLARILLVVSAALFAWAAAVAVTGGFRIDLGSIRISSRNPSRIFLMAALPAALAWRLAYRDALEVWLRANRLLLQRLAFVSSVLFAAGVVAAGVKYGSRTAAASDPSGYVSQSALWASGSLKIDQTFAKGLPWPEASQTLTPLGYRINVSGEMVPTYAPGVPLLMALGRLVSDCGPYLVGPICGALLVLFTFQLGRPIFGTGAAAAAAALAACSPVVIFMTLVPMADVPAAACWVGALAVARGGSRARVILAGLLTALAILIRPNLVPLALFPWLMAMVPASRWQQRAVLTVLFAAASLPGPVVVGWVNAALYGSPLTSGYGDLGPGFSFDYAAVNIRRYPAWWLESQGLFAFLFLGALWPRRDANPMRRERAVLAGFALASALLYVFYLPFEAWWFLRFLLPAVPIAFLFCAETVTRLAGFTATVRCAALAAFTVIVAAHATRFTDTLNLLDIGTGERRYFEPALHVAATVPPEAVIITMQHSGSVRYYTGRLIVRWDNLDPAWLDRAVAFLNGKGLPVYLLVESWEEPQVRERFAGQGVLSQLDRGPIATARGGEIRLYPLLGDAQPATGVPVSLPIADDRACHDISPDFRRPKAVDRLQ